MDKSDIEDWIFRNFIFIIIGFFIILIGLLFFNSITPLVGGILIGLLFGGFLGLLIGMYLGFTIKRTKFYEYVGIISLSNITRHIIENQNSNSFEEIKDLPHDAIILAYGEKATKYLLYSLGVDILVDSFSSSRTKIPYWIYECSNKQQFKEILENPNIRSIWIFGHGVRHGVDFGHEIAYYCEMNCINHLNFIGQYHCCHLGGASLADINNSDNSDVTNDLRNSKETRASIRRELGRRGIEFKSDFQLLYSALSIVFSRKIK